MSQRFSLKSDEVRQEQPLAEGNTMVQEDGNHYPSHGNARNLCLILPDGRMTFLNYAYLIAGDCDELCVEIVLSYTTHVVKISGSGLQGLFFELMDQRPRLLSCTEERYRALQPQGMPIVHNIQVMGV